jgi:hypothetical protein
MSSNTVSTDSSLRALRDAHPRNDPGFEAYLEPFKGLAEQIRTAPTAPARRPQRRAPRRRLIGLSAALAGATALAAAAGSLTLGGESPPSAYAAARTALAATAAKHSGTMTLTVNGATLYTERWNRRAVALRKGESSPLVIGHVFGPNLQMVLVGGGVYVQEPDGRWTHYASEAALGDKLGPEPYLLHANMDGNTARQILAVASDLHQTPGPDGTTVYRGTIRNPHRDPQQNLGQDEVTAMIAKLRGDGASDSQAPGGTYPDHSKLVMVVGRDGLVHRISFIFRQPASGTQASSHRTIIWTVGYSHLGDDRPITAPATSTTASR